MMVKDKEERRISIEQAIRAYQQVSTDQIHSWRHSLQIPLSHPSLMDCTKEERVNEFSKRVEFNVTIADNITSLQGNVSTGKGLINMIFNKSFADTPKKYRKVIYSTSNGERPVGNKAYLLWNGFQVIDMDIKDKDIAIKLKTHLFNELKKFNWFLGVVLSSSGAGLHIYTKILIPQSYDNDLKKRKLIYFTNFRHKYSFVYLASKKVIEDYGKTEEDLLKWMDLSMFRPSQGAFIPYDPQALISTLFYEDDIYICFDDVDDMGDPTVDWVSYPPLKKAFRRWEYFEDSDTSKLEVSVTDAPELDSVNGTYTYHYKHNERWKLANTLVQLYGLEKGYKYMRQICSNDTTDKEIQGDCLTASRHNKPIEQWAVNRLNKYHGFKIKTESDSNQIDPQLTSLYNTIDSIDNPLMFIQPSNRKDFYITKDQHLGDIKDDILSAVDHITLIEAGAGVGKTEMVKSIAREGKKVLLVLPYTSTIKSKIEGDEFWKYAYANRKVDLTGNIAMTVDKFSRISPVELKESNFDYVFIDESHLLFSSSYRTVMPTVIDNIAHSEVPIIMMTGTPTGELIFFPDLTYIHVTKEDVRKKEFHVIVSENDNEMLLDICRSMAKDISEGKRVIFPTNKGTQFGETVHAYVQYFCENEFHCRYSSSDNPVNINYYKKSNNGDDFMDNININKTIGNTDILLCSNYLSVGVDIKDKYDFSVYFDDFFMPQEIEQFANRLRENDLYVYFFVSRCDKDGNPKPIFNYRDINLKLDEEELKYVQAMLQLGNSFTERTQVEYKYNNVIASMFQSCKFIKYDDIENKYYIDKTAYQVEMFEKKYRDFIEQLPVIIKGMICYGYEYSTETRKFVKSDNIDIDVLVSEKKLRHNTLRGKKADYTYELINLITEDRLSIYQDAKKGKYDYKKGNEWSEDIENKTMTVKDIEVFEKVIPIFLSLYRIYDLDSIRSIFEYCKKGSMYNFAAIKRIRSLSMIIYNEKRDRLDMPIKEYMNEVYDFVNSHEKDGVTKGDIDKFVNEYALKYAKSESREDVPIWSSSLALEEVQESLLDIFKCLVDISRPGKDKKMHIKRCEILWEEKNNDVNKFNDIIAHDFILGDMLDDFEVKSIDVVEKPNDEIDITREEEEEEEWMDKDTSKYIISY